MGVDIERIKRLQEIYFKRPESISALPLRKSLDSINALLQYTSIKRTIMLTIW